MREDCFKIIGKDFCDLHDTYVDDFGFTVVVEPVNYLEGGQKLDRIHLARDVPIFKYVDERLLYVDRIKIIDELVPLLKEQIDKEMFMRDYLEDQGINTLIDLKERLIDAETNKPKEKKRVKISKTPRCFEIKVGGKPGQPLTLMLRE